MSPRTIAIVVILVLIIAFGMVFSLKRSLKAGAGGDLDSGSRLPAKSAPR